MSTPTIGTNAASPSEVNDIVALYQQLLRAWNERNARDFAALFAADGHVIGFDGSLMDGPTEIEATLSPIFAHHPTAAYVSKLRGVEQLAPDVVLLRALVGMLPPGGTDLNPAVNAIQTLVACQRDGAWHIALFQNTPAAFHGRPELVERMTQELREVLQAQSSGVGGT
jgi:uncharacterized protein (TIGR02246 family)